MKLLQAIRASVASEVAIAANYSDAGQCEAPKLPDTPLLLVTGGCGFIGSTLVDELLSQGFRVRVLDTIDTGYVQYMDIANPNLDLRVGSIEDYDTVASALNGVSGVVHLAAASKVAPSLKDPGMASFNVRVNAVGTATVLEAAAKAGTVKRFIYAASSTYYGNQPVPFSETDPFVPSSPYAASKYMGELLTLTYDKVFNLPVVNLRFFMVYGPRQPTTGGYAIVTGRFIKQYSDNTPLTIEGSGENFRDFIHVKDIVNGLILAYKSDIRGVTVNLGSGSQFSVKQVADLISSNQTHVPPRPHDLVGTLANTSLAEQLLGFKTKYDFANETVRMRNNAGDMYLNPFWTRYSVRVTLDEAILGYSNMTLEEQSVSVTQLIKERGFKEIQELLVR